MSYRVLHVLDHSWPVLDGYSQRSRSMIAAQSRNGMEPRILTGPLHQADDPNESEISLDGIRYSRTPVSHGVLGRAIHGRWPVLREWAVVRLLRRRIERLLVDEPFDIIHAHSPALCNLAALQGVRRRGLPFVYEIRSFWEDSDLDQNKSAAKLLRYRLGKDLETYVVRRADAVVSIAQRILQDLETRGILPAKLFHVPNGVDSTRFTFLPRDSTLDAELGIGGIPTLGFLGTLFPWEGIAWLVRAAAELHRRGSRFKLLIVGDGAEASEVKRAIRECSAEPYVSYLGRVAHDQVERYYSVMDVLVYPRRSVRIAEFVTPLKPLEAMAQGKAVLGSGVGGLRELIEPEVTGNLFEPGSIDDFCRQASRLLEQPDLRRTLGERARQRITADRDWAVLARRYENVYEAAIRNARARR